uniref:N-acetylgalactosaminide beta-1,3-galactosyltransferase n=2 Tax=Kalmanozyma brasiliensis (strain GHG001) TaxID=1365824 RepID=V5E979_KALBG
MVLITKVGSATVHKRLLIHLAEQPHSNIYAPNRLYVSDYPLTLGNITFYDALSNVSSTLSSIEEFSALRGELRALMESNQDLDLMSDKDGGWKLDKYKFLPMMGEAYRRFPGKKWYVMVEADTFLFWNELVKWLSTFDPDQQYMLGRPMFCDFDDRKSTPFMHGGSGFVLSRAVMEASYGVDPEFEHNHDNLTQHAAFGDALLTKALYDAPGVNLTDLSPESGERFNTDTPRSVKFTDGLWCRPVLTFHHVTPSDTAHLYDFQRRIEPRLGVNDTVRWCDVWDEFIPLFLRKALKEAAEHDPEIVLPLDEVAPGEVGVVGWKAFEDDDDTRVVSTKNALDCLAKCRSNEGCMMWEWKEKEGMGQCRLGEDFLRIGVTKPRTNDGLTTGWMGRRVDAWRNNLSCSGRTGLNDYAPKDAWRAEDKVEEVVSAEEAEEVPVEEVQEVKQVKADKVGKVLESVAQKHEEKTPPKKEQQKKVADKPKEEQHEKEEQHKDESHKQQQQQHKDKQ